MNRIRRGAFVGCLLAVSFLAFGPAAGESAAGTGPVAHSGRVVIVAVPRLEWADLEGGAAPAIDGFVADAAYALASIRAIGPLTGLAEGYVTLGAGNRATFADRLVRPVDVGPGAGGVSWSIRPARLNADAKLYGSEPGAFGSALRAAGLTTALVGDPALAALAIADEAGRIDAVAVDAVPDQWPAADVTVAVLDDLDALEPGDDSDRYRRVLPPADGGGRAAAVRRLDERFAAVLARIDDTDLVLLVAPSASGDAGRLTVFAARGPGVRAGRAQSATTRRAGYVTLADIAPTVLGWKGIEVPDSMNGTAITGGHGSDEAATISARLAELAVRATYRDRTIGPVSVVYIVVQVAVYGAAALAVVRGRRRWLGAAASVALGVLAFPTVTFLSGLVAYRRLPLAGYVLALVVSAVLLAAAVRRLTSSDLAAAVGLVTIGWLVQVVDIVTGGRLQLDTPFGYSPIVAGRFQGYGNLAFSIVAMSALVVMTAGRAAGAPRGGSVGAEVDGPPVRWAVWVPGAVAVALITLVADGAPPFGADVGGVLAFLPAAAVTLLVLTGRRVGLARLAAVGALAAAALVGFAWLDLRRPAADRTHLARFATKFTNGDAGLILRRKLEANLHILTSSVWTWLMPVAIGFLVVIATRPRGTLAALQRSVPGTRACLSGAASLGLLGFVFNDSGIAIPAMMCGVLLPWLVVLVHERRP